MPETILVTGGTGYIGSHTVVQLLNAGNRVVIIDNLCNSNPTVIDRIETITDKRPEFIHGDIRDRKVLQETFRNYPIDAVMHFAGLKAVGESEAEPFKYFDNNVAGSIVLFDEMARAGVRTVVFSSSATVYGNPGYAQYREDSPLAPINVYGRTKLMVEEILREIHRTQSEWRIALLRYFNPVGAHESGLIGEDPSGIPNNLMPFIAQVAVGQREKLMVFGNDYPTPDGTGLRDYIHVEDLAAGHLAALRVPERTRRDHYRQSRHRAAEQRARDRLQRSRKHRANAFRTRSSRAARVIWPSSMPNQPSPGKFSTGKRNMISTVCAWTPGDGRRPTHQDLASLADQA